MSETEVAPEAVVTSAAGVVPRRSSPPKAKGIDISSWQHPSGRPIDFEAVRDAGYTFVMIKATQGDSYTYEWLKEDFAAAHAAGLICGAYHFYEVGVAPATQAEYFTSSLVGHVTELGCWLDWEPASMPDYQALNEYTAFVDEAEKARSPIGLYCDQSWHEAFVRVNTPIRRLWIGDWSNVPLPYGAMLIQRLPEKVPGIEVAVDIDELTSTRGINFPRHAPDVGVPPPAAVAIDATAEEEPKAVEGAEQPEAPEPHPEPS